VLTCLPFAALMFWFFSCLLAVLHIDLRGSDTLFIECI